MRIAKWDNLKFGLIYLVVLGHFIQLFKSESFFLSGLQFFIYTFHMPAFLFVSGLFSKRTIDERRYDKILPYLILYIFMKILRFLVYSTLNKKASGFSFFYENGVPWFALVLFLCYLITIAFSRYNHTYLMIIAVCIGMIAGYDSGLGDFLSGMRLFTLYPFFLAGYCIPIQRVTEITERKTVKVVSAVLLAGVFVCSFVLHDRLQGKLSFLKVKAGYDAMGMANFGGIYRGVYYVIALVLVFCVIAMTPSVHCVFTQWGGRTLQVFALHFPILKILKDGFHLKEHLSGILPNHYGYLFPVIALIVTVVLSAKCMEPFFNWLMHPRLVQKEKK